MKAAKTNKFKPCVGIREGRAGRQRAAVCSGVGADGVDWWLRKVDRMPSKQPGVARAPGLTGTCGRRRGTRLQ